MSCVKSPRRRRGGANLTQKERYELVKREAEVNEFISPQLSECHRFESFFKNYRITRFLGKGAHAFVVEVQEVKTGRFYAGVSPPTSKISPPVVGKFYAARIRCLDEETEPCEFKAIKEITKHKEALRNVTTLYDCAVLDTVEFRRFWKETPPEGFETEELAEFTVYFCEETYVYLVLITDIVDTTMENLLKQAEEEGREAEKIKAYHFLELYYTLIRCLEVGIEPDDIIPGNIGLVETSHPVFYRICDCVLEFPPGLHVRLIDYEYYKITRSVPLGSIRNDDIKKILSRMTAETVAVELRPSSDLTSGAYYVWREIMESDKSAMATLLDLAQDFFGCFVSPRKKASTPLEAGATVSSFGGYDDKGWCKVWESEIEERPKAWRLIPVAKNAQEIIRNFLPFP